MGCTPLLAAAEDYAHLIEEDDEEDEDEDEEKWRIWEN